MSHRPSAREQHEAATDHRNEAAQRVRDTVRLEERVGRQTSERWLRRIQPLMPDPSRVVDDPDFPGCVW